MKKNGFVEAVTTAINKDSDCWEAEYYCGFNFDFKRLAVYMHSRAVALGPEWESLQQCIVMITGNRLHQKVMTNVNYQLLIDANKIKFS